MYLVDANVLIEAKNRYYAFDIAPGFWEWLEGAHATGEVGSIEAVRSELVGGNDELSEWAKANGSFFQPIVKLAPVTAGLGCRSGRKHHD
ncbi:MAG TPA: DUF4411 family protein [Mycobacterium sp.]|nr:DUF4411 family protein [Mycobacterium sp.]